MRAEAIVAVERRDGRDVCARLRSDPPLTLRFADGAVHVVASGAGPLGGDHLTTRVDVGPGASLKLRSVAASMVLPGPGTSPSRSSFHAHVGTGGLLDLQLQPQMVVAGADHEATTTIQLDDGASLVWRDETILGRHEEPGGSLIHRIRVTGDGPLLVADLAVGPRWTESLGPAGLDGSRSMGSLLLVGPRAGRCAPPPEVPLDGIRGAVMVLDDGAQLASVVGRAPGATARWLDGVAACVTELSTREVVGVGE